MARQPLVGVLMGSDSDLPVMRHCLDALSSFKLSHEVAVLSAHRNPDDVAAYARQAVNRGIKVIIAAAGGAAHLAGLVAAHTTLPVIGVPIPSTTLQGLDSLLSIVQMPKGIPVATVAIGEAGAHNAGILAAQIIGSFDASVAQRLAAHKEKMRQSVRAKNERLRKLF